LDLEFAYKLNLERSSPVGVNDKGNFRIPIVTQFTVAGIVSCVEMMVPADRQSDGTWGRPLKSINDNTV
jgi:antitoxin component of MazEF toxin-antitoxin module